MKRILGIILLASFTVFAAIGCQNGPTPTESTDFAGNFQLQAPKYVPDGATLESATLHIYIARPNDQEIFIHRITSDWDELTVTFDNFGGAYDMTAVGSFNADVTGWKTADVTSLVAGWNNGDNMNFGLLLDQDEFNTPRAIYRSRDYASAHPYLEVCYDVDGETVCENFVDIADTYIWEIHPDSNYGTEEILYTGWVAENDLDKQSLIRFEEPEDEPPQEGCTLTIGFWKNHAGLGPQADVLSQYLPITLGNGGGESVVVSDAATAVMIFTMGKNNAKNGVHKLMAQLLAAKLNIAAGASDDDISEYLGEADDFLTDYSGDDWENLDEGTQSYVLNLKDMFDDYNNGIIGPGHCDEFNDDDDCDKDEHTYLDRHHKSHDRHDGCNGKFRGKRKRH